MPLTMQFDDRERAQLEALRTALVAFATWADTNARRFSNVDIHEAMYAHQDGIEGRKVGSGSPTAYRVNAQKALQRSCTDIRAGISALEALQAGETLNDQQEAVLNALFVDTYNQPKGSFPLAVTVISKMANEASHADGSTDYHNHNRTQLSKDDHPELLQQNKALSGVQAVASRLGRALSESAKQRHNHMLDDISRELGRPAPKSGRW